MSEGRARVDSARRELADAGTALAQHREQAAPGFVRALEQATAGLAMDGARFEVAFTDLPFDRWTMEGPHRVEFLYAPAPGQPPGRLRE